MLKDTMAAYTICAMHTDIGESGHLKQPDFKPGAIEHAVTPSESCVC
jgi:hypothetical protein